MDKDDYMDDIHARILRVTEDLRAIQRELNYAAMQAPGDPELMEALNEVPEVESIQLLKTALDQMRHFLWFYSQVMSNDSEIGRSFPQPTETQMADVPVEVKKAPQAQTAVPEIWGSFRSDMDRLFDWPRRGGFTSGNGTTTSIYSGQ